ncbi:hypothetical protein [Mycobacterium sp. Marseille-P9652]|uniref:hypothetical protein n=1 Tax=Mycobacterium sp. Marseille-P9652 TaxID=2654950 RepID=UPI0012E743FE|nr:hypothetical protein [Mycobacterium sp. Marseille-P9652]
MMETMSAAIVVAVVGLLVLLGIGMVTNQLLRLRRYLREAPPGPLPGDKPRDPPGPLPS